MHYVLMGARRSLNPSNIYVSTSKLFRDTQGCIIRGITLNALQC